MLFLSSDWNLMQKAKILTLFYITLQFVRFSIYDSFRLLDI